MTFEKNKIMFASGVIVITSVIPGTSSSRPWHFQFKALVFYTRSEVWSQNSVKAYVDSAIMETGQDFMCRWSDIAITPKSNTRQFYIILFSAISIDMKIVMAFFFNLHG